MATYRRETCVRAPLEDVWEFHSTPAGLERLTPGYLNLEVHEAVGPEGTPDPAVLEAGATVRVSVRPFGVGPRRYWTSRIVERRREDGAARFSDVVEAGPFGRWEHAHRFFADGEWTRVVDELEYDPPGGPLGAALTPFGRVGLDTLFRERHRRTKRALEG